MINMKLAEERGLDEETIEKIKLSQKFLNVVLMNPDMVINDPKDVAECIEACEFRLQVLWGFEQSKKSHRYEFDVKWCRCPKLDNAEMVGGQTSGISIWNVLTMALIQHKLGMM